MVEEVEAAAYVPIETMRRWGTSIFAELGLPQEDAAFVTETLVRASLRGVDSHGVMRIPIYAERLMRGGMNPRPKMRVITESAATAIVDGDAGMGQVVAKYAMELAIRKAAESGTSFVLARNTNHFGAAAYWAEMALAQDMIGWATTNTPPIVAPWGSRKAVIGNNPLAIATPTQEEPPLLLDMALSTVAGGKLRYAAKKGLAIPDDWALGPDGMPTTDPNRGSGGVLLPMGKHKGSGLSVMIETFTGLLAGTGWAEDVQIVWEKTDIPGNVASAFGAINIAAFIPPELFKRSVDAMARTIGAAEPAPGVERVYVPGGPEAEQHDKRLQTGIPLPSQVIKEMRDLGRRIEVPFPIDEGDR